MILKVINSILSDIWPMLIIFLVVIISVRLASLKNNKERFVFYKEFWDLVFIVYILILFELLTSTEINNHGGMNLVPFTEIFRYKIGSEFFLVNVIGNILIFVPFGYFISGFIKSKNILPITLISILTSTTVEFVQLRIGRSFDIDDIILNLVGGIIGFLIYVAFSAIKKHLPGFLQTDLFYNIMSLLILICFVLYVMKKFSFGWF